MLQPCTIRDFMNYLKYIEHSAENLQFFLWFRDYSTRWEQLPARDKALAPEWTQAQAEAETAAHQPTRPQKANPQVTAILQETDFADPPSKPSEKVDPFNTPPKSPSIDEKRDVMSEYGSSMADEKTLASSTAHRAMAEQAFDDAGLKWKPCMHLFPPS